MIPGLLTAYYSRQSTSAEIKGAYANVSFINPTLNSKETLHDVCISVDTVAFTISTKQFLKQTLNSGYVYAVSLKFIFI